MADHSAELLNRFLGDAGKPAFLDALRGQSLAVGSPELADALSHQSELLALPKGQVLIAQGAGDNDVYLVLAGSFLIEVNGREIAMRGAGECLGEMAATLPSLPRSATVKAAEDSVVARLTAANLAALGDQFPRLWREIAKTMAKRLIQRNRLVEPTRARITVFIISSAEAIPIVRAIHNNFAHDPFFIKPWTHGVFRASEYPIESLELQLDVSDFAIAVAQGDDAVNRRDKTLVTARDNVVFELGLFVGRLGRARSFLVEAREGQIVLPSDLAGIMTLPYRSGPEKDLDTLLAPACNKLREIFKDLGPV